MKDVGQIIIEAEAAYKSLPPLKFSESVKPSSIENALWLAIIGNKDTFDKDGMLQCEGFRRRSITDLLRICNSYFPKVTLKDIIVGINNLENVRGMYCGNVNKYVTLFDEDFEEDFDDKWEEEETELNVWMDDILDHYNIRR